jgi:hypothetical protein
MPLREVVKHSRRALPVVCCGSKRPRVHRFAISQRIIQPMMRACVIQHTNDGGKSSWAVATLRWHRLTARGAIVCVRVFGHLSGRSPPLSPA